MTVAWEEELSDFVQDECFHLVNSIWGFTNGWMQITFFLSLSLSFFHFLWPNYVVQLGLELIM
jgi:hypothetical protein